MSHITVCAMPHAGGWHPASWRRPGALGNDIWNPEREIIQEYRGPGTIVGSPATITDYMEAQVNSGACDGFALLLQGCPEELNDFVDYVVPELQRRERFRTEYDNTTFRNLLKLERPRNQFVQESE